MSKLIIIAGPQAAGKSTVVAHVTSYFSNATTLFSSGTAPTVFPLQESRQLIVHKNMLLGAIFMTPEHEKEVVDCDMKRMQLIQVRNHENFLYLDECNVFTLAHAAAHGITAMEQYWDEYVTHLKALNAAVIFLNVPPDISWDRRCNKYEQRLAYFSAEKHDEIRQRFKTYLQDVHPLLLKLYDQLPLPKEMINGSSSMENVTRAVCAQIAHFMSDI